jgi:hypothetical protein
MENVDDYDGVFEDLYNKYKSRLEVAPEVKLIMMLGGSAMMFHLTNSMFKSAVPNMNDVMKQNPDLLKSMMSAVQNTTTAPPQTDSNGRTEMRGPGLDISGLMGGIMMPPMPPVSSSVVQERIQEQEETESVSDIMSVVGESIEGDIKDVSVEKPKRKRGRPSKKNEVTL